MKLKEGAVIIGTYINAYSIYKGLKAINFSGQIFAIETQQEAKTFIEIVAKDVQVIKKKLETINDIIDIIHRLNVDKKYIFFTNEEYMDVIKKAIERGEISNVIAFTGSEIDNNLIFNRYKFYKFIEKNKLALVPKTISSDEDPFIFLGEKFIIRPNNSWEDNIKTPRLSIVENKETLEAIEKGYTELGMTRNMWCYQEVLSSLSRHNLSVCGWYEQGEKKFFVTRKVVQHPPKTGCGDVVEIVEEYPEKLLEYTENILSALKYRGPFELEFVYDIDTGRYCVIELNPRYWMQHELLERNTDYYLIRKNIGQNSVQALSKNIRYKYWINTNQFLYRILKGQFSLFKYLKTSVKAPGMLRSIKWMRFYYNLKKNNKES